MREYDQLKSHVQSYLCSMPVYSTLNFSCFLDVMKLYSLLPHSWVFPIAYLLYFRCTLCFSIKIAIHKQPSPDLSLQSSIHCYDGQAKELPSDDKIVFRGNERDPQISHESDDFVV